MAAIPGTENLPEHVQSIALVAFGIFVAILQAWGVSRGKSAQKKELASNEQQAIQATSKIVAFGPSADRLTLDTFQQTLNEVQTLLRRIADRMDEEEEDQRIQEAVDRRLMQKQANELKQKD